VDPRNVTVKEFPMPWTSEQYPVSMRNLPPCVRRKAIEIVNALREEGMAGGRAIRIAMAKARQWAGRRFETAPG
jgi:uncharacterized protein YdaT